ncbi:MAG: polysaccharide deacetylase family protein [Chloroflexi bacterium]|nr:polysaccharide deacetylase family protein [Chloroflexota bacterium]
MSTWIPFLASVMVIFGTISCRDGGGQPTMSPSPAFEAGQTAVPPNIPASSPTAAPSPEPAPKEATAILSEKGNATGGERQTGPGGTIQPVVSSVEIDQGSGKRREVALTFDAGASAAPAPKILSALKKHKVQATMFLTGQWAEANPELVKQLVAQGFELANHSYSHAEFTKLATVQMREELARTEAIVQRLTGQSTKPFFRPPFGDRDARVRDAVAKEGYFTVYWTLDSADWRPEATAAGVRDRVLRLASPGSIIVFHLGSEATAQAIEQVVVGLQENDLSLVKLSRLLAER